MTTTQKLPIRCTHDRGQICPQCSAYRMVFLLKNGFDFMKETAPNGRKINPVRYNFVSKNRKGIKYNVDGMLRRFATDPIMKYANVIQVYENFPGGEKVAEIRQ